MSLLGSATKIKELHQLIKKGFTGGKSAIAKKLKLSRGTVDSYFNFIKSQGITINYDPNHKKYYYNHDEEVEFICGFKINNKNNQKS